MSSLSPELSSAVKISCAGGPPMGQTGKENEAWQQAVRKGCDVAVAFPCPCFYSYLGRW